MYPNNFALWFDRELDCTVLTEGYGYLSVPAETVEVQTAEVTDRPSHNSTTMDSGYKFHVGTKQKLTLFPK